MTTAKDKLGPTQKAGAKPALEVLDLLATLVLLVGAKGEVLFANSATQEIFGLPGKLIEGNLLSDFFVDYKTIISSLHSAQKANSLGQVFVELIPLEQQAKQDREERIIDQAQANKELIRNLAHEIKNPLGGIRGAAQLLQMEMESKDLVEYTQVIIREADRLQTLVDRLLAPHRKPHEVREVNVHEVCERVRSLILAEFPRGLKVRRDYDTSIPFVHGDVEQLIQAVLNVTHNAAQALSDRIAVGDAQITFKTRVARQVILTKQLYKLALELHVIDNGPGVPEGIKDRLFSPLVSGRDGGSGLGLNLAQTFIQQHRGLIEFESVPGRTDFKILIPLQ